MFILLLAPSIPQQASEDTKACEAQVDVVWQASVYDFDRFLHNKLVQGGRMLNTETTAPLSVASQILSAGMIRRDRFALLQIGDARQECKRAFLAATGDRNRLYIASRMVGEFRMPAPMIQSEAML